MGDKPFGLVVPDYLGTNKIKSFGIPGPYLGDLVWEKLQQKTDDFERITAYLHRYGDTAGKAELSDSVRRKECYVVHPYVVSHDTHVMSSARIGSALKRSYADKVFLVEPYNRAYRQDRKQGRESLDARDIADLHTQYYRKVFALDPHTDHIQLAYGSNCPFESFMLTKQFAGFVNELIPDLSSYVVWGPDRGSITRTNKLANHLGLPFAVLGKRRDPRQTDKSYPTMLIEFPIEYMKNLESMSKEKILDLLTCYVKGKNVLLTDDILGTGGTLVKACALLRDAGTEEIYACITHIDMCLGGEDEDIEKAKRIIMDNNIHIIGTNDMHHIFTEEEKKFFHIYDTSDLLAEIVTRDAHGLSLGDLVD